MTSTYIDHVTVVLGEHTEISSHTRVADECPRASLTVGSQFAGGVTFYVERANPVDLDRLAETASELAAWLRLQAEGGGAR